MPKNIFMPKSTDSTAIIITLKGIEKIKTSQKMTTRQSESNHASIYMSKGLYFCPKLARNDNFAPFEF